MVSLFLLLGCNLSYIVDLFAGLHEIASASARTLLKLASSVRALLKPYGDTLSQCSIFLSMEMPQNFNAHPLVEQLLAAGLPKYWRYGSLLRWGRTLKGWLLTTRTKADTRIVHHARDATLRGYSRQVYVLWRDTVVSFSLLHTGKIHRIFFGTSTRSL